MTPITVPIITVLTVVVAVLSVLVVGLLRSHAAILRALHDGGINLDPDAAPNGEHSHSEQLDSAVGPVPVAAPLRGSGNIDLRTADGVPSPAHVSGQRAIDITGQLATGGARTVALAHTNGSRVRQSTLLAFLTTGCSTCAEFWNSFNDGVDLPGGMRLVIVTKGPHDESPATVAELAPAGATTIMSSEAWDDYGVPVSPYFALVDGASGVVIGEGAAHGWELVRQMLTRAVADAGHGVHRLSDDAPAEESISRRDVLLGRQRDHRIDAELLAAGIKPGDVRLYHASPYESADQTTA